MYLAGSVTPYLGSIWKFVFFYLGGRLVYVVAYLGSKLIWTITYIDWVIQGAAEKPDGCQYNGT